MKKFIRILALALTVAMMLGIAAGCTMESDTPASPSDAGTPGSAASPSGDAGGKDVKDIKIAYVSALLTNEIFAMQVEAMQKYCSDIGVTFLNTPCADDSAKIAAIENYIQAGVDVIICHVSTPEATEDSMKQAQAAGIKFFAYDTPIDGCDTFFGWDNYDYGYAIGANAADWVNATFKDGEVCNAFSANWPNADFTVIRESGYIDALNELCGDKINWAGEAVGGSTANGVTAGENWLQMGIDINLVIGINDAGCLGVYEALNAANYGGDKVAIFAGDATVDAINAMMQPNSIYRGTVLTGLEAYDSTKDDLKKCYLPNPEADQLNPYASPLEETDFDGIPPACFISAECDPILDQALMYAAKLQDNGVPVEYHLYEGMLHAFINRTYQQTFEALDAIIASCPPL
ncbi:MAG: substrate-binding domain-containing protein [Christensenellales bacterium]|jgi:ribose transport system substrate-binding protein